MLLIRFSAVAPTDSDVYLDLSDWREDPGKSGGFGTAWFSSAVEGHILKRLHENISRVESLKKKKECAEHARAIITRLTDIIECDGVNRPSAFVRAMCETLRDTVTTHVGYDQESQGLFLYQKLARGKSLEETFLESEPDWGERVKIAKNFVSAMVALRRCNVVHLDCRPVNVFVDRADVFTKVTLIDLDGCGVLNGLGTARTQDSWSVRPATLGNLAQDIHPIWFPFDASWQLPVSGNFKFAERWRVLSETWRILSWSRMTALGWLEGDWSELIERFERVREMCQPCDLGKTVTEKHARWLECQRPFHSVLAPRVIEALNETQWTQWEEFGLSDGSMQAEQFLESLAAATIIGVLFPKWGSGWNQIGSLQEVPSAKWIQDQLIPLQAR